MYIPTCMHPHARILARGGPLAGVTGEREGGVWEMGKVVWCVGVRTVFLRESVTVRLCE